MDEPLSIGNVVWAAVYLVCWVFWKAYWFGKDNPSRKGH